jgi:molybdate transport system substrate-binding protein
MKANAMKSNALKMGLAAGMVLAAWVTAQAGEIKVISSVGVRAALEQLKPEFERITSHKLTLIWGSAVPLKRQIDAGATFDVAILTPSMIDELVKVGKVAAGTKPMWPKSAWV